MFLTLASFWAKEFHALYRNLDSHISFDVLYKLIAAAEWDSQGGGHPARDALETAVKWLSGLHGDPDSAFAEIGIENFGEPDSLLSIVNNPAYAPSIYTGAVISANPNFDEILRSIVIGGKANGWIARFWSFLMGIVLWFIRRVKVFGLSVGSHEQAAGKLYSNAVMAQWGQTPSSSTGGWLQAEYKRDVTVLKPLGRTHIIPAYSHDFIVPSVYQLLPDSARFLGHYVNLHASHNSGKSQDCPAGRENIRALHQLMKALAARLSTGR